MKNLFKLVCFIAILAGSFAFGQSTSNQKKPIIKVIHCKKITVTVHIGIVDVGTDITGCLVTVDGLPVMVWTKQAQNQTDGQPKYIYVNEKEMMEVLKVKDSKELENLKIVKSGIWDYDGENYIINSELDYKIVDLDGQRYFAFPIVKAE